MSLAGTLNSADVERLQQEVAGKKIVAVTWDPNALVRHMNLWAAGALATGLEDAFPIVGLLLNDGRYLAALNRPFQAGWALADDSPGLPWWLLDRQAEITAVRVEQADFGEQLCLEHTLDPQDPITFAVARDGSPWDNHTHFPPSIFQQYLKPNKEA